MKRAVPLAILTLAVTGLLYIWGGHWSDASVTVRIASALTIAAALAGVIIAPSRVRIHAAIAGFLMLTLAAFTSTRVIGKWPFEWDAMPDPRYAAFITISAVAVGVGLIVGQFWARWAAIAFASATALGGILNSFHLLRDRDERAWLAAIGVFGGAIILSQLLRADVREYFTRNTKHAVWAQRDRLIFTARWAAIANFGAAPMLLLYALGQPVAPSTVVSALLLAPVLFLGATLVVLRRSLGIAVLAAGGVGLLAQTVASYELVALSVDHRTVCYYAAFWLPAAVLSILAGAIAFSRSR